MSYIKHEMGDTPYYIILERKAEYELVPRSERSLAERKEAGHHSHRAGRTNP